MKKGVLMGLAVLGIAATVLTIAATSGFVLANGASAAQPLNTPQGSCMNGCTGMIDQSAKTEQGCAQTNCSENQCVNGSACIGTCPGNCTTCECGCAGQCASCGCCSTGICAGSCAGDSAGNCSACGCNGQVAGCESACVGSCIGAVSGACSGQCAA